MFEHVPHKFRKLKGVSPEVCQNCGLVSINNYLTEWAIRKGCNNDEHPDLPRVRVELVKKWQSERGLP